MSGGSVRAVSGFSPSFEEYDSWVSTYREPPQTFSVALAQTSYPRISATLKRRPDLVESDYERQTFRFVNDYYRRGAEKETLIPVAVGSKEYSARRREEYRRKSWDELASGKLGQQQQGRDQGGLGVSINLPKRLDKIFGEGGAGLRVSGYRKIMFSGRSQWTDDAKSPIVEQSKFPSLNMEQQYQFNITGTIGSKITVKVEQDSHTDLPLANRIQIRYKGDDDDILKSIEAGNTNLSLPNTQFVGYSSRIRGLFGVKAEAQLGPLWLTAIASQEKGSSERTTITPTGEESAKIIRDAEYVERRIFDLFRPGETSVGDEVVKIFVYREMDNYSDERPPEAVYADMYVDPDDTTRFGSESVEMSDPERGVVLEEDFEYYSFPDRNEHYIVFPRPMRDRPLGVYMEVRRGTDGPIDTIGVNVGRGSVDTNPKILKLIYSPNALPTSETWDLMWRNIYDIPKGVRIDQFDIKIYKGDVGAEQNTSSVEYQETSAGVQNYIEILGLDLYNQSGDVLAPDGKIDERTEIFRPEWGLIIFPARRPFDSDTTFELQSGTTQELEVKVGGIYEYESGTEKTKASKYFLKLFSKSRSSEIRLGRPNIIEGSERVTLNGSPLQRGTDYRIDYDFGRLTLLSADAQDPNADIDIDFEYAPFLAVQKKTLFGFRAEYEFNKDLKIGSTVLYKSDKAQDRKPRVGEETAKAFVFDVDASWNLETGFLTSLANALPVVQTEAPSNLRLSGEVAQSHPNPNVEGDAYIDDFEASAEQTSLGINRTQWFPASEPVQLRGRFAQRSKLLWHNPRELLRLDEVYDRETEAGQSTIRSLRLIFRPSTIDTTEWVWEPDPENAGDSVFVPVTEPSPGNSWAGIQRYFRGRIDADRVQLFEIRARATSGKIHLEFGRISEDINGDGVAFNEDRQPVGQFPESEDVGLDSLADVNEPYYHPVYNPDPNGDNWYFEGQGKCPFPASLCNNDAFQDTAWKNDSIYYEFLNGSEGNRFDYEFLAEPDKELYGNQFVEDNGYFTYTIDFGADSPFRVEETKFEDSSDLTNPAWYTYRIPIRDSTFLDSIIVDNPGDENLTPEWNGERISHVRIWFEGENGQTKPDTIEIADWYFVQSNWRDTVVFGDGSPQTTKLVAASVGEDDRTFDPPSEVEPYEDPTTGVTEAQRGLMLKFDNLDYRDQAFARKEILTIDRYSGYRRLQMYVYGDLDLSDIGHVMFYFRLGRDSTNFYEQRRIVQNGWELQNYIDIDFNELTAFKDSIQRGVDQREWPNLDATSADGVLRVKGTPNLNEIKYFAAGVVNLDSSGIRAPSGEVWLDELRVTDVRRDVGTAARFSANGNIADLGNYAFSYQTQDPYFRQISSATRGGSDQNLGSGKTDTRMSYNMSLNLDRFLPRSWGARLPLSFSYSKSTRTPLLRTGSDIVLPEELRSEEREISESRNFSISASFNKPGKNPLFSLLLNRLETTSFSFRRSVNQSPRTPYGLSESYNVRSGFDFAMTEPPTLQFLFWTKWIPILNRVSETKLGLYPRTWRISGGFDRTLSISDDVDGNRRSSFTRNLDGRMDIAYDLFENLSMSLKYSTRRDLSNTEDVNLSLSNLKLGLETNYSQSFSAKYDPRIFSWFSTELSFSSNYGDDYERSTESRRSTMSNAWGVGGTFNHIGFLGGDGGAGGGRRYSGRRRGGHRAGEEGDEKQDQGDGRPFYDPPLAVLRFLTGWIEPPRYSYGESFRYSLPGMAERPRAEYRFGLSRTPDVELSSTTRNPDAGEGLNYDVSSGFNLLGGIDTDVKFSRSISRDIIKRSGLYESRSTNWPDLSIRIQRFTTLPLLKGIVNKFIDVFSPRTGYSRATRETEDIEGGFVTAKSTTINQNPVLSINFKLFRKLSLSSSYALSTEIKEQFNRTNGEFQSESESTRKTVAASAQYSFAAPSGIKLPLFGRVKFRSQVNITLDVKYNTSLSETRDSNGDLTSATEKKETSIRPDISYTFSQQIRGGLSMRWVDSETTNRKSHLREVQVWMEIRF